MPPKTSWSFNVTTTTGLAQGQGVDCVGCWRVVSQWVGFGRDHGKPTNPGGVTEADIKEVLSIYPWWEILQAANAPIAMTVGAGDKITISIFKASANMCATTLDDDTTGQDFRTEEAYTGPVSAADFIVEARSTDGTVGPATVLIRWRCIPRPPISPIFRLWVPQLLAPP